MAQESAAAAALAPDIDGVGGDDDGGAGNEGRSKGLAVDDDSDHRDKRQAQEVQRGDDDGVSFAVVSVGNDENNANVARVEPATQAKTRSPSRRRLFDGSTICF